MSHINNSRTRSTRHNDTSSNIRTKVLSHGVTGSNGKKQACDVADMYIVLKISPINKSNVVTAFTSGQAGGLPG